MIASVIVPLQKEHEDVNKLRFFKNYFLVFPHTSLSLEWSLLYNRCRNSRSYICQASSPSVLGCIVKGKPPVLVGRAGGSMALEGTKHKWGSLWQLHPTSAHFFRGAGSFLTLLTFGYCPPFLNISVLPTSLQPECLNSAPLLNEMSRV